nr:hypothetical protein [Nitrosomonas nitrosa]
MDQLNDILTLIAQKHLDIETLETRNRDVLDFHYLPVWYIKAALLAAFEAGQQANTHHQQS